MWIFIQLLAFAALAGIGRAAPSGRELLTNIPKSLSGVQVAHTFPNFAQARQIVVGEKVTTLVTVRNEHESDISVNYIAGSINSDRSFNIYLHNLTTMGYKIPVAKGAEQSFEYLFATPPNMPARQFRLALTLFYEERNEDVTPHAYTFFNSTIEVMEPERLIDTEALFLYITLLGIAAAIVYVIYCLVKEMTWFKDMSKKATKKKPTTATDAPAAADKSEWLAGTPHDLLQRKRSGKKAK